MLLPLLSGITVLGLNRCLVWEEDFESWPIVDIFILFCDAVQGNLQYIESGRTVRWAR
jgi:hypothetical protein